MSQRSSNGPRFIYDLCPSHLVALNTTCITNPPNVSFPLTQCLPNHQRVPRVLDLWLHVTLPQTSSRPKNIYLPTYTYRTILLHHKQTTTSTFVDPLRIYIRCVRAPSPARVRLPFPTICCPPFPAVCPQVFLTLTTVCHVVRSSCSYRYSFSSSYASITVSAVRRLAYHTT